MKIKMLLIVVLSGLNGCSVGFLSDSARAEAVKYVQDMLSLPPQHAQIVVASFEVCAKKLPRVADMPACMRGQVKDQFKLGGNFNMTVDGLWSYWSNTNVWFIAKLFS